ncbi:LysE family translocator [Flavihumibacter sp. UBA7668]|uniref:LysE family translocator n=1 Tax=Flavihumibacter sp. UBA7668 TaxID=1946542 RepID=UPI0025C03B8C|nr:LysE family transporter [Flavihumibacter sp. UBA7668]
MVNLFFLFVAGLLISFLGSLPLGTLNITAMQIAVQENVRRSLYYSIGVALVELIYVRLSLKGIDWILANQTVFYYMEWATVVLFAVLGISSLLVARKKNSEAKPVLLNNQVNRFWLGVSMSAINPVQIPFWFLWSSYLFSTKLLQSDALHFNIYTIGIALGTISGLLLFIFGGKWLVKRINASQRAIHLAVAIVFLLSSAIQLVRVLNKPMQDRLKSTSFSKQSRLDEIAGK